jgi:hypothetical protein
VAPDTPQLAYLNTTSLYQDLLTDWLTYADQHGISREAAFYHVSQPTPFTGNSPSSQPVDWFWGVYLAGGTPDFVDVTAAAHSSQPITLGGAGQSLYIGYPEEFNEINFRVESGARSGWAGVLQYPTAVDAEGNPTAWATLRTTTNTSAGLSRSGKVLFDPPANWKPAVAGGSAPLYYLRLLTVRDGHAPVISSILGDDYVHAHGGSSGVIPTFDYALDVNHDGYLTDAQYAKAVAAGYSARFAYQSRLFYGYYGQERFATNPSNADFRAWAVDYSKRYLQRHPYSGGLFMDNSSGSPFLSTTNILESTSSYSHDYGAMLNAISKAIAPRWILANTAGGSTTADGVVSQNTGCFEEFALRPLAQSYSQFEDLAALVAHRAGLRSPPPYAVLDHRRNWRSRPISSRPFKACRRNSVSHAGSQPLPGPSLACPG